MQKIQSRKTRKRIAKIEAAIQSHQNNIARLYAFSEGRLTLEDRKYRRTQEDEARMHWTIKNLTDQLVLLQVELTTLLKYGA